MFFCFFYFFFKYEHYYIFKMPKKIVPTNQKGIKYFFFNKNESNQNVVTIHSLYLAFSTSQHLLIQLHWMIQLHWLIKLHWLTKKNIDPFLGNYKKNIDPFLVNFFCDTWFCVKNRHWSRCTIKISYKYIFLFFTYFFEMF